VIEVTLVEQGERSNVASVLSHHGRIEDADARLPDIVDP
jgi:hypothetical protein